MSGASGVMKRVLAFVGLNQKNKLVKLDLKILIAQTITDSILCFWTLHLDFTIFHDIKSL